ncbi:hypothetical protein AZE42_10450 [Rhizopogon vesiculosus]|uniref:Uncharacterized protein n=1 Tax=Rhizopogon vesiculosus TaxID=180088 RepID=A0A1J8PRN1_9AGAM|nr:hypothetical protein AZE42_10450 [Rhizopogon vesiculosus]
MDSVQIWDLLRALAYIEWFTPFREPDPSSGLRQSVTFDSTTAPECSCDTRR